MSSEKEHNDANQPERRLGERRAGVDRREMIRFEPDKRDRRSGRDRRADSAGWTYTSI